MMNIILLGAPGSGKGTQSKILIKDFDLKHLSTGDMLRERCKIEDELGLYIKNQIDNGHFVSDETILKIIEEEFVSNPSSKGYLFDGYPRNIAQAKQFDELMKKLGRKIDYVINLEINDQVILERISGRLVCRCGETYHQKYNPPVDEGVCDKCGRKLYQRADDNVESFKVRLKTYYELTRPLVDYYMTKKLLTNINGLQSIKKINEDIKKHLEVKRSDN